MLPLDQTDAITNLTQQFGQGMSATSAQVASLYQTIGNGGVRMPLTLVDGLRDGRTAPGPRRRPTEGTRVVSEYAADTTVQMMEMTAQEGSLKDVLKIPGYRVAAKTGTAEVAENGVVRHGAHRVGRRAHPGRRPAVRRCRDASRSPIR